MTDKRDDAIRRLCEDSGFDADDYHDFGAGQSEPEADQEGTSEWRLLDDLCADIGEEPLEAEGSGTDPAASRQPKQARRDIPSSTQPEMSEPTSEPDPVQSGRGPSLDEVFGLPTASEPTPEPPIDPADARQPCPPAAVDDQQRPASARIGDVFARLRGEAPEPEPEEESAGGELRALFNRLGS